MNNLLIEKINNLYDIIDNSNKILIVTPEKQDADSLGSAIALSSLLNKINKSNQILANNNIPKQLSFLTNNINISHNIENALSFIIQFDNINFEIENIKVIKDKITGKTKIIIIPKKGEISHNNISFPKGDLLYDTIIYVDSSNIDQFDYFLSKVQISSNTKTIVIDHHKSNTEYAMLNLIDINISSTCELVYNIFFKRKYSNLLDANISTALLAGIISDTNSFKNENTTLSTFTVAAELIKAGADKKTIINNLYSNKTLESAKLWARLINKIQYDKRSRISYLKIYQQDFIETNTTYDDLNNIIDEIIKNIANTDIALLIYPKENKIYVSLRSMNDEIDISSFAFLHGGGGHAKAAAFSVEGNSVDAVASKVLNDLYMFLGLGEIKNYSNISSSKDVLLNQKNINQNQVNRIDINQTSQKYIKNLKKIPQQTNKKEFDNNTNRLNNFNNNTNNTNFNNKNKFQKNNDINRNFSLYNKNTTSLNTNINNENINNNIINSNDDIKDNENSLLTDEKNNIDINVEKKDIQQNEIKSDKNNDVNSINENNSINNKIKYNIPSPF